MSIGYRKIDGGVFDSLTFSGKLTLANAEVRGETKVNGPLLVRTTRVAQMTIRGKLTMDGSQASGDVTALGYIKATRSEIAGTLHVSSDVAEIDTSRLKDVHFRVDRLAATQTLYLIGATVITGNIVFDSGSGRVIKGPEAVIQGEVRGGVIEEEA